MAACQFPALPQPAARAAAHFEGHLPGPAVLGARWALLSFCSFAIGLSTHTCMEHLPEPAVLGARWALLRRLNCCDGLMFHVGTPAWAYCPRGQGDPALALPLDCLAVAICVCEFVHLGAWRPRSAVVGGPLQPTHFMSTRSAQHNWFMPFCVKGKGGLMWALIAGHAHTHTRRQPTHRAQPAGGGSKSWKFTALQPAAQLVAQTRCLQATYPSS